MEKKTALQQAIDAISYTDIPKEAVIQILHDLLPTERQQIEDAFRDGDADRHIYELGGLFKYANKNDYYEQTYGK